MHANIVSAGTLVPATHAIPPIISGIDVIVTDVGKCFFAGLAICELYQHSEPKSTLTHNRNRRARGQSLYGCVVDAGGRYQNAERLTLS